MYSIFKVLFLSLCVIANTHFAYAQTASILPQGKTQFLDNNGNPLTSGTVDFFVPATTTRKTTWQNSAESIANTNPIVLDGGGRALIYGDGVYRQVVKDRLGNVIWDQLTSSSGSGSSSGPVATGDGDLVGTIKPWAGMTAPNQYAFTYGQEVSRTTFSVLFTAITSSQAVFCTSGSSVLSGIGDTTNFWIGMSVETSCVPAGFSTVASKTATSVTLVALANVTTNSTAIFFPWGRGNGTTTFNLPDFRGFTLAGNNIMGGVSGSQLTTAFFGVTDPNSSGAPGGSQSKVMLLTNLPPQTPAGTIVSTFTGTSLSNLGFAAAASGFGQGIWFGGTGASVSGAIPNGTVASTFNGTPFAGQNSTPISSIGPTKTANYIIKITPDANSATASGVTDIQGMTGSIACSAGLVCTGNTITATGSIQFTSVSPGIVPASGGGTINYLRADGLWTNPSLSGCQSGWFCVSGYGSPALAVAALNAAGGGTLYFDTTVTVAAALVITVDTTILCKSNATKILTSSSTADLFTLSSNTVTVRDCGLGYSGGAIKTAGYLINSTGTFGTFDNLLFDGNCWRCLNSAGIIKVITNTTMNANTQAVAGTSGGVVNTAEVLHMSNVTIGSGPTFTYDFGLLINQGAVDAVNLELLQEAVPIKITPGVGVAAFLKLATSYLDNCASQCMLLQTNGGAIGYVEVNSTEFGTANTTASNIQIDTATFGGNIGPITVSNSNIFAYNANSSNAIILVGSLSDINFNNSQIGNKHANGFSTFGAATATLNINNNRFTATTNAINFSAAQTTPIIQGNRYGGGAAGYAGSVATYIVNNVP